MRLLSFNLGNKNYQKFQKNHKKVQKNTAKFTFVVFSLIVLLRLFPRLCILFLLYCIPP